MDVPCIYSRASESYRSRLRSLLVCLYDIFRATTITLTWHSSKYKVDKLHQRYILKDSQKRISMQLEFTLSRIQHPQTRDSAVFPLLDEERNWPSFGKSRIAEQSREKGKGC